MLLAASILSAIWLPARAEPYRPERADELIETLPAGFIGPATGPGSSSGPADETLDLELERAQSLLELTALTGDPRYAGRARGALEPWWNVEDPPVRLALVRSRVARAGHAFDKARRDLEQVLAQRPEMVQAQLELATVLTITGALEEAESACVRLARIHPGLLAQACLADVQSLQGGAAWHLAQLEAGLAADRSGAVPSDAERAYVEAVTGDVAARAGDVVSAERHYRAALELQPRDIATRTRLADLLVSLGRHAEVAALLDDPGGVAALVLRAAMAEAALDGSRQGELKDWLERHFTLLRQRGDTVHLRDEALYALRFEEDPALALDLALRNWQVQKQSDDAALVLHAALAAGRPEAATPVIEWLDAHRVDDATLTPLRARWREAAT